MVRQIKNVEHEKYRWFVTSSRKLVIGGKSAEQNEFLVGELLKSGKNYVVLHTKQSGSPFSIIQSEKVNEKDIDEAAIFTACFSRAWRSKAKKVVVDIFRASELYKNKGMKAGTFGVKKKIKSKTVELKLYFAKQKGKLRAVPMKRGKLIIVPGNISKEKIARQISGKFNVSHQEAEMALPTGGSKIEN